MSDKQLHKLGIDIGSTTVKIAILDSQDNILFSDYERHFANIQETLASLIAKASNELGDLSVSPVITGSPAGNTCRGSTTASGAPGTRGVCSRCSTPAICTAAGSDFTSAGNSGSSLSGWPPTSTSIRCSTDGFSPVFPPRGAE